MARNRRLPDIHTFHAELVHAAVDVPFALAYLNGILPATITDINQKNVQRVLEKYFSIAGIPIVNERPGGAKNGVNLVYTTAVEFVEGSLEVWLSGLKLNGDLTDADRDYSPNLTNDGFTIHIDAAKPHRLNRAPRQFESLLVSYRKRITFNTKGGT